VGYKVFRNNIQVATTTSPVYVDTNDIYDTQVYVYYVKAFDAAGNVSESSNVTKVFRFRKITPIHSGAVATSTSVDLDVPIITL
jgi:chitinase